MTQAIPFKSMGESPLLLTDAQVQELENSQEAHELRHFSLTALTFTPEQIVKNLQDAGHDLALESIQEGVKAINAYIDCAAANLALAKLAKARVLIAAGAYTELTQEARDD